VHYSFLNYGSRYAREPKAKNEMHAADSTSNDLSAETSVQIDALGKINGGVPEHFILV
jgi:hypothetical protein